MMNKRVLSGIMGIASIIMMLIMIRFLYAVGFPWFSTWLLKRRTPVTLMTPEEYIEQETSIGLTLCYLFLFCIWMYIVGTLLIVLVIALALIIFYKAIEIVMNIVYFISVASVSGIEIVRWALIPLTAVIVYLTWDTMKDLVAKHF